MKYTLIFSIFLTCLITACATMQGSRSVEIDGEPLVYMERGMGSPTIVLEAGDCITVDMGGTSFDVSLVCDGAAKLGQPTPPSPDSITRRWTGLATCW